MKPGTPPLQSTRLLDQVRERIRYMHYSLSTEQVFTFTGCGFSYAGLGAVGKCCTRATSVRLG